MRYVRGLTSREGGFERTGSRTPMQWDGSPLGGFSTNPNATPYLPMDPLADRPTVAAQRADRDSLWHHVERLIYLRVTESDLAPDAPLVVLSETSPGYPLVYRRGALVDRRDQSRPRQSYRVVAAARRRRRRAVAPLPGDARAEGLATARRGTRVWRVHCSVVGRWVGGDRCCGASSPCSSASMPRSPRSNSRLRSRGDERAFTRDPIERWRPTRRMCGVLGGPPATGMSPAERPGMARASPTQHTPPPGIEAPSHRDDANCEPARKSGLPDPEMPAAWL